ncbi:hypothetical protein GCM10008967_11340 [Bacillus carboniphilus]|uniref:NIPSNAP domain-containing protein n=1 Tax=Bacillus carboniphilus TaxID=86663 RepID=A0ABP3FQK5_9BACI
MSVFVYQTFELKQESLVEGLKNARKIQSYRNEKYDHKAELLTPVSGNDFTYAYLFEFEGLAEMELQNKKMFEDEEYKKMISELFMQQIVQGSMNTQIYRTISGLKVDSEADSDKEKK